MMKARKGSTFLEYALLAALIAVVGAIGVSKFGTEIKDFFLNLASKTAEVNSATK